MQKVRLGETISTSSEASDKVLTFCKNQPNSDFSDIITELTELEQEGTKLLKQSKLDDAKDKFMKGHDKFETISEKFIIYLQIMTKWNRFYPCINFPCQKSPNVISSKKIIKRRLYTI